MRHFIALSPDPDVHAAEVGTRILGSLGNDVWLWSMRLTAAPQSSVTDWLNGDAAVGVSPVPAVAFGAATGADDDSLEAARVLGRWSHLWEVQSHVQYDSCPPDSSTALYRLGIVKRLPSLTPEAFSRHYLGTHAPLVVATRPLFTRYVVNISMSANDGWDAVNEQRFEDSETWAAHDAAILASKPEIREDLRRFVGAMVQFAGHDRMTYSSDFDSPESERI